VREYLEIDWAEHEENCRKCEASELDRDEFGYCSICKRRPIEQRFPVEFRTWFENLKRLWLWHRAGFPLDAEPLSVSDWAALAYITRYYEVKDLQALVPVVAASGQ
jgi:hypothetical protein